MYFEYVTKCGWCAIVKSADFAKIWTFDIQKIKKCQDRMELIKWV